MQTYPLDRHERLAISQRPGQPACSVIAILAGAVLVGPHGRSIDHVRADVLCQCITLGCDLWARLVFMPYSPVDQTSKEERYLMPTEVLKHIHTHLSKMALMAFGIILTADAPPPDQTDWRPLAEFQGLHCVGRPPAAILEFLEATRIIDTTPLDPSAPPPDPPPPMATLPLEQAIYELENMSARLHMPLAGAITYQAHTVLLVAHYLDAQNSNYYALNSLPGELYADTSISNIMNHLFLTWLMPYRYAGSDELIGAQLEMMGTTPPGAYFMTVFPINF